MAAKYSTQNISELQSRKVFFDTNVLIYIFWPSGAYSWELSYYQAFSQLLRQDNELCVDFKTSEIDILTANLAILKN